jgi:2-keto-3-deoxy-L-rhamnonate aldolase RhmA
MEEIPTGIRENRTLAVLRQGGIAVGAEAATDARWLPVAYAEAGLDFVWIDLEHALPDPSTVAAHIQTARLAGITPLVRVPSLDGSLVRRLLDNGAQGIVLPFVEQAEVVADLVSFCRFHPAGRRGAATPLLAHDFAAVTFAEHVRHDDGSLLKCVQIESATGVEAADAIAATAGLDLIVLGLGDLSLSLGVPDDVTHPRVDEAVRRVLEACRGHGVWGGIAGGYARVDDGEQLRRWAGYGARLFHCFSDIWLLQAALAEHAQRIRHSLM